MVTATRIDVRRATQTNTANPFVAHVQWLRSLPYDMYLQTRHWSRMTNQSHVFWGSRCALCNSFTSLQGHHRTYDRVGYELFTDVVSLCDECHELFSNHRELAKR
jgi:hypothetical protein